MTHWPETPSRALDYDDMNTLPASYDTMGRYYYLRGNLKFDF